ncbi:MAG: autotransporter outer membrane beta-barrel domain-containing protein, partial [Pseudomonadota bacterium]
MNRSYKSVWNAALGAWVAVSEITRAAGKRSSATVVAGTVALLLTGMALDAQALTCAVSNSTDAGAGSLRGCVTDSNTSNPAPATSNVINANGAQTITPATGGINITRSVEIGTGGDALTYQMSGGTRGLVIPAGTSGVHLVLGEKFKLIGTNIANFQAVSIGSAGNTVDLLGTIDLRGGLTPAGRTGIVANGGNNVINVSGTIQGYSSNGAAIRTFGDLNIINVSGALSNTSVIIGGGAIWATGNRNVIDVSGTINVRGGGPHYGINIEGNDNQLNVSGSVTDTLSNAPFNGSNGVIGVAGDNNSINISGSVTAPSASSVHHGIDVNSGTNNSIIVQTSGTVSAAGGNAIVFKDTIGTSSLTNHGTITGNVTMSGGDSILSIGTGSSISGTVNGSTGNNLLRLIGNGTDTYDGTFTNFQKLEVNAAGGMWSLLNNQTYTNGTSILAGTLSVNSILGGTMEVHGGRLQGIGQVGNTTNFTGGTIAPGNSIGTLLIAGDYTGNGGVLEMEAVLAGTGSPADRLLITGNATGNTMVNVINTGGSGALTGTGNTDGISIIQVGGTSTASTFQLAGGYAVAGPYQYILKAFDPATSAATEVDPLLGTAPFWDYRLQSLVDSSGNPVAVPQVAGYQAMPTGAVRYGASLLDSLHKRLGEIRETATLQNQIGSTEQRSKEVF